MTITRCLAALSTPEARAVPLLTAVSCAITAYVRVPSYLLELLTLELDLREVASIHAVGALANLWVAISSVEETNAVRLGATIPRTGALEHRWRLQLKQLRLLLDNRMATLLHLLRLGWFWRLL